MDGGAGLHDWCERIEAMKATGIVRRIDHLARIVLPKELRAQLEISEGTPLEIYMEGNMIVLEEYARGCVLCGGVESLTEHRGQLVCTGSAGSLLVMCPRRGAFGWTRDDYMMGQERGPVGNCCTLAEGPAAISEVVAWP